MKNLRYDFEHMLSSGSGEGGVRPDELMRLHQPLLAAHANLDRLRLDATQGFLDLPFATDALPLIREHAARARDFDVLIVIGIGGSDLAARTILQALGTEKGMAVKFLSSPDPEAIAPLLADPDLLMNAAINVISKSGSTLETLAIFFTLREALIKRVGQAEHKERIFVTTDPKDSPLYRLAKAEGYAVLPHPLNVGGRFSALSVVGLFPAACAGIDPAELLAGAAELEAERRSSGIEHMTAKFAALHHAAMTNHGQDVHVLMPYATRLASFASWYRQLWAESLGKRKGNRNVGPTPIASLGPIDQHSQMQLYVEGPADKTITFIEVDAFRSDLRVPSVSDEQVGYMGGRSFTELMHAERAGTANALAQLQRPNGTIHIPRIDAGSLGALFQFFMASTAYMGELMGINAFDQPGVESGKHEIRAILEGHL